MFFWIPYFLTIVRRLLVRVHARNLNVGAYPTDKFAAAAVKVDAVVPPVRSLQITHTSPHTLTVKWGAPAWYVSEFSITISQLLDSSGWGGVGVVAQAGQVLTRRTLAPTQAQQFTFADLLPNTSYRVSVTAHSLLVQDEAPGGVQVMNVTGVTREQPVAPSGLRAINVGPDFVVLCWDHVLATSDMSATTHFRLFLNTTGGGHGSTLFTQKRSKILVSFGNLPPSGGGLVCGDLSPSTEYVISVQACGPGGCSNYNSRTMWTAPYSPTDFSVSTIETSPGIEIALKWTAPCSTTLDVADVFPNGNGNPLPSCPSGVHTSLDVRYLVSHRRIVTENAFGPWNSEVSSDSSGTLGTMTLSALTIGSDYHVRLVAVYQGMRSEPVFVTAKVTSSPLSVENFGVAPDSKHGILEQSVTMQWRKPGASAVSHYMLSWAKVVSSIVAPYLAGGGGLGNAQSGVLEFDMRLYNEFTNGSGYTYFAVTGLETHARYSFRIQARNFNGNGYENGLGCPANSDIITSVCFTASPVQQPAPVQQLHVKSATPSLIEVEWLPPPGAESTFRNLLVFSLSRAIVGDLVGTETVLASSLALPGSGAKKVSYRDISAVPSVIYRYRVRARNRNSLGFEDGTSVLASLLTSMCTSSNAGCAVTNVRAVAFAGREGLDGMGVVVEWEPPTSLFAGIVPEQFYYRIRVSMNPLTPWAAANDQVKSD